MGKVGMGWAGKGGGSGTYLIMADEPEEAAKLTGLSDGLVVNIGTLNQHSINAMYLSAQAAWGKNFPRVPAETI